MLPQVLRHAVHILLQPLQRRGCAISQQLREPRSRLLCAKIKLQLRLHTQRRLWTHIAHTRAAHRPEQRAQLRRVLPTNTERLAGERPETEPARAISRCPTHCISELLAELHGGRGCARPLLRVSSEQVPEIDVEQAAIGAEHEVIKMAVPDAKEVRYNAVTRAGAQEGVVHSLGTAREAAAAAAGTATRIRRDGGEESEERAMLREHAAARDCTRHELDNAGCG